MAGQIGILNVGAGDTKLTFDKTNPAECIRAARIVTDMLRRGYALLVEVDDGAGGKAFTRVREFREATCEYIIADFDSIVAAEADKAETAPGEETEPAHGAEASEAGGEGEATAAAPRRARRTIGTRAVPAAETRGVAVARSAGG